MPAVEPGRDRVAVASEFEMSTEEGDAPPSWATLGPRDLVDHLESSHHRYLREELPYLEELIDQVVAKHGRRHPELDDVARCLCALRADLEPHLMKEERVLFPMVRELAAASTAPTLSATPTFHCGSVRNPISVMLVEHDRVAGLLATMRELTRGYAVPADGCASYSVLYAGLAELESDTHLHVHKENNLLFPAVVAMEDRLTIARG